MPGSVLVLKVKIGSKDIRSRGKMLRIFFCFQLEWDFGFLPVKIFKKFFSQDFVAEKWKMTDKTQAGGKDTKNEEETG